MTCISPTVLFKQHFHKIDVSWHEWNTNIDLSMCGEVRHTWTLDDGPNELSTRIDMRSMSPTATRTCMEIARDTHLLKQIKKGDGKLMCSHNE